MLLIQESNQSAIHSVKLRKGLGKCQLPGPLCMLDLGLETFENGTILVLECLIIAYSTDLQSHARGQTTRAH